MIPQDNSEDFRQLCRKDFLTFCRAMYPPFEAPRHIQLLAHELENVERRETPRLMITMPPRHGKTMTSSQMFPAWYLGRNPAHSIIMITYSQSLSNDSGEAVRNMMTDPLYKWIFPESVLRAGSKARDRFTTSKGGKGFFVGVGGAITGRGANLLCIDDVYKDDEEADSEAIRHRVREFYKGTAYTRLMPGGAVVIIGTRWRHDDLMGWLQDDKEQLRVAAWKKFDLPAIAGEERSQWDWRQPGEALWPERFPVETLEQIKMEGVGSRAFQAMYQQRPTAQEGNIFKKAYLLEVALQDIENDLISPKIMFLDTAFKEEQHNDYSAAVAACRTRGGDVIILEAMHRRLDFPRLLAWTKTIIQQHEIEALYVEDKASGQSLVQTLKTELSIPIVPIKAETDKVARANAILPFLEAGRTKFKKPIFPELEQELLTFPFASHDDLVDACVGAITVLTRANFSLSLRRSGGGSVPASIYGR